MREDTLVVDKENQVQVNSMESPLKKRRIEGEEIETSSTSASARAANNPRSAMGVIDEIYCENFMCHSKLRVKLGRNINFITGENGSGKSAIIAALQICLGASARSTQRAKSLKSLIRHESQSNALIRITLINDDSGSDAFRYSQYGDRIIVERIIRRDGTSSYALKRTDGTIVSRLKSDIAAMVDHLNIQIDNPCAILSQDTAKSFLQGDGKDKYKFFLKATELFNMKTNYQAMKESGDFIKNNVMSTEKLKLQALQGAKVEAERLVTEASEYTRLEEIKNETKAKIISAMIKVHQNELNTMKEQLDNYRGALDTALVKSNKLKEQAAKTNEKLDGKNRCIADATKKKAAIEEEEKILKRKLKDARTPVVDCEAELKELEKKIRRNKKKIKSSKVEMEKKTLEYQRRHRSDESEIEQFKQQIEALERQLEENTATLSQTSTECDEKAQEKGEMEQKLHACASMRSQVENQLSRERSKLRSMKSKKANELVVFGDTVPRVLDLIARDKRKFSIVPIGPLGKFVKLPEEFKKYGQIIENVLGHTMRSFVVDNGRDKVILEKIRKEANCPADQCPIIIRKRSSQRYQNINLPDREFASHAIANIIKVSDDFVYNVLVDSTKMEGKLVFDERAEAEATFIGELGNQRMAKNVTECYYLPHGDRTFVRNGNKGTRGAPKRTRPPSLTSSTEKLAEQCKYQIATCENNMAVHDRDYKAFEKQKAAISAAELHLRKKCDDLESLNISQQNRIAELKDQLEKGQENEDLDLSFYEGEIAGAKSDIEIAEAHIEEASSKHKELYDTFEVVQNEYKAKTQERDVQISIVDALEEDLRAVYDDHVQIRSAEAAQSTKVKHIEDKIAEKESDVDTRDEAIQKSTSKAEALHGKLRDTSRSVSYYEKQYQDITRRIKEEKDKFDGVDLNTLKNDAETKKAKYNRKRAELLAFEQNSTTVTLKVEQREKNWVKLRKSIATSSSHAFNRIMEMRDFAGKLKFDYTAENLEIVVARADGESSGKDTQIKDMKSLSGGERSFAQIAMLLALGETLECPFRVMDEFDVFMDSVNRTLTMELLVTAAKADMTKQFIFITPNDLSSLSRDPAVRIQKMNAPRT